MEKSKVEREEGRKAHVPSQALKPRGIMATGIAERGASNYLVDPMRDHVTRKREVV